MDRRRTLKINWDDFDDFDDDDEFFESTNRLSSVVPLDMPLSDDDDDDDQEFDDTRMSFSTNSVKEFQNVRVAAAVSTAEYDIWMAAPGSINDRRRKLLQGMGLNSNKDFVRLTSTTSTKLNKVMTKRLVSRKPEFTPPKENIKPKIIPMVRESPAHIEETKKEERHHPQSKPQPKPQPQPKPEPQLQPQPRAKAQPQPQAQAQAQPKHQAQASSLPVLLVRSRSDGDIDTSSFNTKQRKEEMIGSISKQRLTRTSSALVTPTVGISCQYANIVRVSTPNRAILKSSVAVATKKNKTHDGNSTPQLDSFFLIKNLDTGKEFIVKEFNDDGMWNKVSDLQTGKQLTMDEFEKTVGHSPVVKELMRRASRGRNGHANSKLSMTNSYFSKSFRTSKKMGAEILKNIKGSMSGSKTAKEKDGGAKTTTTTTNTSPSPAKEPTKGEQKSSTDKNQSSEWVKARAHGKPLKEFSALHLCQEIKVHEGSIWAMKFSFDGHYLATAGEDKDIHIWEVQECDVMPMRTGDDTSSGASPDNKPPLPDSSEKKKKGKNTKKKRGVPDYAKVPETVFGLSEKPVCTFKGHQDDVLALSWSRSELLLSSSMDKTVRLWDIKTKNCLKQFAHSDYVTCIQFNPTDDNYFISGSLDAKVRIWSVPSRKVVDWTDLHDMVTAVCYSPDGLGAIVGLHKGSCRLYSTTDRKLEEKEQTESLSNKKVEPKKITGFQFSPSNPSEVLVTSADSRVRILDGLNVVHKFKGYKNTSSQFSAEYSADGKYIICASEDSLVYIWKHEKPKNAGAAKTKYATTVSYEHFPCTEVTVAVPWPGSSNLQRLEVETQSKRDSKTPDNSTQNKKSSPLPPSHKKNASESDNSEQPSNTESSVGASDTGDSSSNNVQATAWGLVIVTAGVGGEIRVYQNVGLPVKVGRQTNLFRDLT